MLQVILTNIDIFIVIIYLIITLFLGIFTGKNINNFKEYAIGKKKLPTIIISITVCATLIGGGSSLGTAAEVFKYGIIVMVAKYGVSIGAILTAYFIIPRMSKFCDKISIGEIMGEMYGKHVRIITGIAGALLCTGRIGAQIMALGFVAKYFFGVSEVVGAIYGALIIIIYSTIGGIRSVVFTDILQFSALAITIPILLDISLSSIGGYEKLIISLPQEKITIFPNKQMFIKYIFVFVYMMIPMLSPPLVQRILMSESTEQAKKSFVFLAATDIVFTTIASFIGLVAYVTAPTTAPNESFLFLINQLDTGIKALAVIGILSVIMSTADSYLNSVSISIVHDVLAPINIIISSDTKLFWSRVVTIITGLMATLFAIYFENVFELAIYSSNFWGPIVVGPLLLGLFNIKISKNICIFSIICGIITFILWEYYQLKILTDIYSIIPAILINVSVSIIPIVIKNFNFKKNKKFNDNKILKDFF